MTDVVIDSVLHDGQSLVVVRGVGRENAAFRIVGERVVFGRAPVRGEAWAVVGTWEDNEIYGRQFRASRAILVRPSGQLLIETLARSSNFPGVGIVRARALWETHGPSLYGILEAGDTTSLLGVLSPEHAACVIEGWKTSTMDVIAHQWLDRHGFPCGLAHKLIRIYMNIYGPGAGASAESPLIKHLESDPYRMLAFASWKRVDAAARQMGVAVDDSRRMTGALEAALIRALKQGHTWQPRSSVLRAASEIAGLPTKTLERGLLQATSESAVKVVGTGIQLPGCNVMEKYVMNKCEEMASHQYRAEQLRLSPEMNDQSIKSLLLEFARNEGYSLTSEQGDAIRMAMFQPISLLLGGPGVGKTTVLKAVHVAVEKCHGRVLQAALSGRAAHRMSEASGRPASTIAALLTRLDRGDITLDDEPLIILDECSMIDLATFYSLLRHFKPGCRLLMVGDPGQLPPIGFGLTFHVLVDDNTIVRTVLTHVQRQSSASGIPAACESVRAGIPPQLVEFKSGLQTGVSFVHAKPINMTQAVVDVIADLGPETQVIGPVKRGPGGTVEINSVLHSIMSVGRRSCAPGFCEGQPVMMTRNDYRLGVMNGELGYVFGPAEGGGITCDFGGTLTVFPPERLIELELGYAITCHKSQGSQFERVVVPIRSSRVLDRSLLLTAISRARKQVVIVGDMRAFAHAVTAPAGPSVRNVGFHRGLAVGNG